MGNSISVQSEARKKLGEIGKLIALEDQEIGEYLKRFDNQSTDIRGLRNLAITEIEQEQRKKFFKQFKQQKTKDQTSVNVEKVTKLVKGWNLSEDELQSLRKDLEKWKSNPGCFFQPKSTRSTGQYRHIEYTFNDLDHSSDSTVRKVTLMFLSEYLETEEEKLRRSYTKSRNISQSNKPPVKLSAQVIAPVAQDIWGKQNGDLGKKRKSLSEKSRKGKKWRELDEPALALALPGAIVKKFEDSRLTESECKAINKFSQTLRAFRYIGELRDTYDELRAEYAKLSGFNITASSQSEDNVHERRPIENNGRSIGSESPGCPSTEPYDDCDQVEHSDTMIEHDEDATAQTTPHHPTTPSEISATLPHSRAGQGQEATFRGNRDTPTALSIQTGVPNHASEQQLNAERMEIESVDDVGRYEDQQVGEMATPTAPVPTDVPEKDQSMQMTNGQAMNPGIASRQLPALPTTPRTADCSSAPSKSVETTRAYDNYQTFGQLNNGHGMHTHGVLNAKNQAIPQNWPVDPYNQYAQQVPDPSADQTREGNDRGGIQPTGSSNTTAQTDTNSERSNGASNEKQSNRQVCGQPSEFFDTQVSTIGDGMRISQQSDTAAFETEGLGDEQTSGSDESLSYPPESHSGLNVLADESRKRPYAATQDTQEEGTGKRSRQRREQENESLSTHANAQGPTSHSSTTADSHPSDRSEEAAAGVPDSPSKPMLNGPPPWDPSFEYWDPSFWEWPTNF